MDSFELNKLIGALLGTVFIVFSISLVSDAIFAAPTPDKPGYVIEAAEADHGGGGAAEKPAEKPIAELLATADPDAGAKIFKKCAACHTDDKSGANKVGPNLWGVVNRPVASHEGFSYSAGMKDFAQGGTVWDYDHLNNFLISPKALVKGTAMGFAGLKKEEDRADIIAYLRTQADTPEPLPEVTAAPAGENAATTPDSEAAAQPASAEGDAGKEPAAAADGEAKEPASGDGGAKTEPDAGDAKTEPTPAQ